MKRIILVSALILCLALSLCGCGEVPKEAGRYDCIGYVYEGVQILDSGFKESDSYILLSPHGRGIFSHDGLSGELNWLSGGEYMEIRIGDKSYEGRIKNGLMEIGISDQLSALFRWDQLPPLESPENTADYYGWWKIVEPQGEMPETWVDCAAAIEFHSGQPELVIFDEDGSKQQPMGRALLSLKDGVFSNLDGGFWYSELKPGDWVLAPNVEEFPGLIKLSGLTKDRSGEEFQYEIYLRPWGDKWDDIQEEKPKLLPFNYEYWYLPLIEEGKPMPDKIG